MRVVTFKIEEELLEELDSLARLRGVPRSELIRRAIEFYLRVNREELRPRPRVVRLTS